MDYRHRVAVIIRREHKVLVIEAQRDASSYFVLPGGGLEFDEGIMECAVREVKEETNLDVQPINIAAIKDHFKEDTHGVEIYVNARVVGGEQAMGFVDEKERERMVALHWKTPQELSKLRFYPEEFRNTDLDFCGAYLGNKEYRADF